ncbi:LysE family transporter [Desulfocurvus sp.]|jgi:threonine/homoserine/homoserine lactone efflux protein|uniref:LysE family transporter n=1 Tax=Desulfocurvus sp. TaxID=2871698 RepID=UPI0025BDC21F|nr:LysE family transporter [Desulfocurvus sp.]MCK9241015.1 LysE family translocator [Desulfocurvus sp.]
MTPELFWTGLTAGAVLGATAGLSPGPLLTLVIRETLCGGVGAGARVALSPLLTDLPIIALCVAALGAAARAQPLLGVAALAGGVFLLHMARETWRSGPPDPDAAPGPARSLARGVVANVLSPHPYLFWMGVGGPLLVRSWAEDRAAPLVFLAGFYALLVGSKLGVAVLVARSRAALAGRGYRLALRLLAVALVLFAALLLRDGWRLLAPDAA